MFGTEIEAGDKIVLLPSSGLHANGASLARRVAAGLPDGWLTVLPSGRLLGEALLDPTVIYARFMRGLLASRVVPVFLNGITGHGFLKVMRAGAGVRYEISELPEVPEVLEFLVEATGMGAAEAYRTLNMGAGYVVIVRPGDVEETLRVAAEAGLEALVAGEVVAGSRALSIGPLGVEYRDDDYQLT